MNILRIFLPLLALLFTLSAEAQTELQSFQLKHRDAAEMITILRPMLDLRGGISGTGHTLLVRSTPENLQEISQLIEQLDIAQRNLLITVRRGELTDAERRGLAAAGEIGNDKGKAIIGEQGQPHVRIYSTKQNRDGRGDESLRVLEGQWAQIKSGQDIPVPQQNIVQSADGSIGVQQSLEYRDVSSGFEVRPRLSDDQVFVAIRPYRAQPALSGGGAIDTSSISTTVSGRLGEWIELGGVDDEQQGHARGILRSTKERDVHRLKTYIRIETID
ncbi:MAG: secretin N-terminal domain-containing protein [Thiohalomonadaceae bacterium]